MPKNLAWKLLFSLAPEYAGKLQSERRRNHDDRFARSIGLPQIASAYIERNGLMVRHGLFAGMSYPEGKSTGSVLVPKLLGSYEVELEPIWKSLFTSDYDTIVDVGCAEGYYAVGFARRQPASHIFAYDTDEHAQELCRTMAAHNTVTGTVSVRGTATPDELNTVLGGRSLILCDCDGAETIVLDPVAVPAMRSSDIVVEVHDFLDSTITPTLRQRFSATHEIEYVASVAKNPDDYPEISFLSAEDQEKAVNEFRPEQGWLVMRAKTSPSSTS